MPSVQNIAAKCEKLLQHIEPENFIYDFLSCFDLAQPSITRLRNSDPKTSYNQAKQNDRDRGVVLWKNKLYFETLPKGQAEQDIHTHIDALRTEKSILRQTPRFIIVTDFETLLAVDTKTHDTLDIPFSNLHQSYTFFLPWAGIEKSQVQNESIADIKAAEEMAKLFDEITTTNPGFDNDALNVFLTRLLFCFFAEDTGIFDKNSFSHSIKQLTSPDGSNVAEHLVTVFAAMNDRDYSNVPTYLRNSDYRFPYVNGGLFRNDTALPVISAKARRMILASGNLGWEQINPDIFGSMFQAVVDTDLRGSLGMHYTSVPNIMKVIEPLFLDELYVQLEKSKSHKQSPEAQLRKLHQRIQNIRIFDPACGSGNFLIIAYKELRRLEMELFRALYSVTHQQEHLSLIDVSHFYGIEIDPFAREVAVLALWLAEHQMNIEAKEKLGDAPASLPLGDAANIVCGNATRLDWEEVCPKVDGLEILIMGNPPYVCYSDRNRSQKEDVKSCLSKLGKVQRLDYIACWFVKATDYISEDRIRCSFVSTNSICQGEQVAMLWPYLFENGIEISNAHQSFKWTNNATSNAGVTCVIICIRRNGDTQKHLYNEGVKREVKNISPYLVEGANIIAEKRNKQISMLPPMILGSSPVDGGNLIISKGEYADCYVDTPSATYLKRFQGGDDILQSEFRHCIWLNDNQLQDALELVSISEKVEKCASWRSSAGRDARAAANTPHKFKYRKHQELPSFVLPMTSSENRNFLPFSCGLESTVYSNGVCVIYASPVHVFSALCSTMHKIWTHAVAGKLESRIRYSVKLAYNTFPFPPITASQKDQLTKATYGVLDTREGYPEKTIAWMYDPDSMPADLLEAHQALDLTVEEIYLNHAKRKKPFKNDEDRLEHLFTLYEQMISEENESNR
jgi:hypothetical protein